MKILIVEDEHLIAASIKKGLQQEHFTVDVAYRGDDGLAMVENTSYDLILLDIMLPEIDGIEICKRLRLQKNHTPILMLTAKSQVQDKVTGLNYGADDYVTKPFSFDELLARIHALTRRPHSYQEPILKVDDLSLNTQTYEVKRDGQSIKLHAREFALLEYLMRHQNTICTKDQIIDHVWDYEANVLPNTVEVYIKNLRQKIDVPFPQKPTLLHTVRGFGYKLGIE